MTNDSELWRKSFLSDFSQNGSINVNKCVDLCGSFWRLKLCIPNHVHENVGRKSLYIANNIIVIVIFLNDKWHLCKINIYLNTDMTTH